MGRLLENTWLYAVPNNRAFKKRKLKTAKHFIISNAKEYAKEKNERTSDRYWNWRKRVLTKDHFACTKCGNTGREVKLEAHHIKAWLDFPEKRFSLDNGITLCFECHNSKHPWRTEKTQKIINQFDNKTQALIKKRLSKLPSWLIK